MILLKPKLGLVNPLAQNLQWPSILLRVEVKELTKAFEILPDLGIQYIFSRSLAYPTLDALPSCCSLDMQDMVQIQGPLYCQLFCLESSFLEIFALKSPFQ